MNPLLEQERSKTHAAISESVAQAKAAGRDLDGFEKQLHHMVDRSFHKTPAEAIEAFARKAGRTPEELFLHNDRLRIPLPSLKTTVTSATVGSSTPGILTPERVAQFVQAARPPLVLRNLLTHRPTNANKVEFVRENVFTNAASPQVEGNAKAESALTFTIAYEAVRTLAHWIPATRQVLNDWTELQRIIEQTMLYGLALEEEQQILTGDGTGENLNGLVTQAAAYVGTYAAQDDTKLDTLRHAVLELRVANEKPDFVVLNPADWHDIELIKDAADNVGNYVVGVPTGAGNPPNLWGLKVVESPNISSGSFLVGDSARAAIFDREEAAVVIATEHDDFFTKNLVAVRVEERIALAVFRTTAFLYGSF